MTDPAELIAKALREANAPADAPTRLATVVGTVGMSSVVVRFDGESVDSAREYRVVYERPYAGDRAIMLRVGSTWVALAAVAEWRAEADPIWDTNVDNRTGRLYRIGGSVHATIEFRFALGWPAFSWNPFTIPDGFRPPRRWEIDLPFSDGSSTVPLLIESTGSVQTRRTVPQFTTVLGSASWAVQA